MTSNGGLYRYNALQAEIRRRYADGFSYQVNYTFQKTLADSLQDTQQSVDPYLDNLNQRLNYARPQYDRTHTVNGNMNLELPFGRGHRWLNYGGIASKIFGGFQMTSIVNISSGAPISILDPRGTLESCRTFGSAAGNLDPVSQRDQEPRRNLQDSKRRILHQSERAASHDACRRRG